MDRMLAVKGAVLLGLDPVRTLLLVLGAGVIDAIAVSALIVDYFTHGVMLLPSKPSPRTVLNR